MPLKQGYQMFVPKPVDVGELATTIVSLVSVNLSVGESRAKDLRQRFPKAQTEQKLKQ